MIRSRRFPLLPALGIACLLAAPGLWAAEGIRIELSAQAEVRYQRVRLADIASVESEDPGQVQRLKDLSLGPAPRNGESARLDKVVLQRWIRTRLGVDPERITWTGASVCMLRTASQNLPGTQIAQVASETLQAALARTSFRSEHRLLRTPRDLSVPTGAIELAARSLPGFSSVSPRTARPSQPALSKRQTVWVDISVEDELIRSVPVDFEVSLFAPALTATRSVSTGEALDPAQLEVKEIEWTGRNPVPSSAETPGAQAQRLRRPLAEGQPLTQAHVEPVPLVARGGYATLVSVQGPIAVESRVEVLQDGLLGQPVRVKLPNALSSIVARVTGPGKVEVQ